MVPDYSDYYPEAPGGRLGGRSVEPVPFDGNRLGDDRKNLEPDYVKAPRNFVITQADYRWLNLLMRNRRGPLRAMKVGMRFLAAKARGKDLLVRGQALMAGLRLGLRDAGVPILLNTPLTELYTEDGAVRGVKALVDGPDGPTEQIIRARHGVVLGSGGFEHNDEMRKKYQRAPIGTEWTVGAAANTGDGIVAGQKLGAAVEFMEDAWWGPSIPLTGGPWFALSERTLPGSMMVKHPRPALRQRGRTVRRGDSHDVRRQVRPGRGSGREHSDLDDPRSALPQPVHLRRHHAALAVPGTLAQGRSGRQGRHDRRTRGEGRAAGPRAHGHRRAVQRLSRATVRTRTSGAATVATTTTTAIRG